MNSRCDVCELYSPPRIVQEAGLRSYGGKRLRPGWSLDLTVNDPETEKTLGLERRQDQDEGRQLDHRGQTLHVDIVTHVHGVFTDPGPQQRSARP